MIVCIALATFVKDVSRALLSLEVNRKFLLFISIFLRRSLWIILHFRTLLAQMNPSKLQRILSVSVGRYFELIGCNHKDDQLLIGALLYRCEFWVKIALLRCSNIGMCACVSRVCACVCVHPAPLVCHQSLVWRVNDSVLQVIFKKFANILIIYPFLC